MLSLAAVAEALDMDERTVRRAIGSRGHDRLIAAKIGGRWKVRLTDLEAYIDAHTVRR
jgi:DNA-binding GntR family transcriptional regulator